MYLWVEFWNRVRGGATFCLSLCLFGLFKDVATSETFLILHEEVFSNSMLLFNYNPSLGVFFKIPAENFACTKKHDSCILTKEGSADLIRLHVLLVSANLYDLHLLCIPDGDLSIDGDWKHLELLIVEIDSSYFSQIVCIVNALAPECLRI